MGSSRTQLCPGIGGGPVNRAGLVIVKSQGCAALNGRNSGHAPSAEELARDPLVGAEGEIVLIVQYETLRAIVACPPVLAVRIISVVAVLAKINAGRSVFGHVAEAF